MKDIIKRAEQGERIILVFPNFEVLRHEFRTVADEHLAGCEVHISEKRLMWGSTGGFIGFMSVQEDPERLRGYDSDVVFMNDSLYMASNKFVDMAEIRAAMYHRRRAAKEMQPKQQKYVDNFFGC